MIDTAVAVRKGTTVKNARSLKPCVPVRPRFRNGSIHDLVGLCFAHEYRGINGRTAFDSTRFIPFVRQNCLDFRDRAAFDSKRLITLVRQQAGLETRLTAFDSTRLSRV